MQQTGYELASVNVFGIEIVSSSFSRNNLDCSDLFGLNSQGGNIRIAYIDSAKCPTLGTDTSVVSIRDVSLSFGRNCGLYNAFDRRISDFPRTGGGLALVGVTFNCSKIEYELDSVDLIGNIGEAGANMFVIGLPVPLRVNKLNCWYGKGGFAGVGMAIVISRSLPSGIRSNLSITNSSFIGNEPADGLSGSGTALLCVHFNSNFYDRILLRSCNFIENKGASIFRVEKNNDLSSESLVVILDDVIIKDNSELTSRGIADFPGAVLLINSICYSSGLQVINTPYTGITIVTSSITFTGSNLIQNNSFTSGGGVVLLGRSTIKFQPPVSISFINNHAYEYGGAIYVPFDDKRVYIRPCFFQIDDPSFSSTPNIIINAINNTAGVTGEFLNGGNLGSCYLVFNPTFSSSPESIYNQLGFRTLLFFIRPPPSPSNRLFISSNPVGVILHGYTEDDRYIFPFEVVLGKLFNVSVTSIGETGGIAPGRIYVTVFNCSEALELCRNPSTQANLGQTSTRTTQSFTNVPIVVHGNQYTTRVSVVLRTELRLPYDFLDDLHLILNITECPPGFNKAEICDCNKFILKHVITCNINSTSITTDGQVWIGYDNASNCTMTADGCPYDYCIGENVSFNILNPDPQCAFHRSGVLCGECADGYSLLLGSNECGECPNDNSLSLLLVFGVAGILLIVLLFTLNLTVTMGTINGLIFYANVVQVNDHIFFINNSPHPLILRQFISFLNLDLGVKTCFYEGMTPYSKAWLQFVFPIYLWLIMVAIVLISRRSTKLTELIGNNTVKVLATLLLLSYTKIIRAIGVALAAEEVMCDDERRSVWRYNGNTIYSETGHVILVLFALSLLVFFVLPYSIFLISLSFSGRVLTRVHCRCLWLKHFSDAYSGPFKESQSFWVGLLLIARVLFVLISAPSFDEKVPLYVIIFTVIFMMTLALDLQGPYEQKILNVLESWFLANLLGMSIIVLGVSKQAANIGTLLSVSLVFVSFLAIIFYHLCKHIVEHYTHLKSMYHNVINWLETVGKSKSSDKLGPKQRESDDDSDVIPKIEFRKANFSEFRDSIFDVLDEDVLQSNNL